MDGRYNPFYLNVAFLYTPWKRQKTKGLEMRV